MTTTYTPGRLQKAIGDIAGKELGFTPNPSGGMKPLPSTSAEIAEIKKIYPKKRCVEFCFLGSTIIHTASALLDHWYREGIDDFQPPTSLNTSSKEEESSWPFTLPENNNVDLLTQIQLLTMIYPPAKPLVPIIQQLIDLMGGQANTVKLLKILASQDSLNIPSILKLLQTPIPENFDVSKIETLKIELPTPNNIPTVPEVEIPKEPLYGAVIPLKGDKTQGYLLLGFLKF